ncbi:NUDIX domain-containing protein [Halovivax sp.]|uniref:NUDIX domain-containing protein n=1 Tax=Halovivax sp. TaxID=1935978 RepID=UPI0025BE1DC5|nr:NUDIX domain-containing protein [Halovivax sp.]
MVAVDADYCPICGAKLGTTTFEGRERRYCPDCDEIVWRNPVPTAGVVVVRDGDRVLVAERAPSRDGEWTVPGGYVEHDESASDAAARELEEETGLRVDSSDLRLLATHHNEYPPLGIYTLLIRCVVDRELTGGSPEPGSDVISVEFRREEDIEDLRMADANRRFVRLALEGDEPYR